MAPAQLHLFAELLQLCARSLPSTRLFAWDSPERASIAALLALVFRRIRSRPLSTPIGLFGVGKQLECEWIGVRNSRFF